MRIVLDLTVAAGDHIEGTASWADLGQPVAFSGWLALMRLLEDAHRSTAAAERRSQPQPPQSTI
jgi:hypothetical protein